MKKKTTKKPVSSIDFGFAKSSAVIDYSSLVVPFIPGRFSNSPPCIQFAPPVQDEEEPKKKPKPPKRGKKMTGTVAQKISALKRQYGKNWYKYYLKTEHWQTTRVKALKHYGNKCKECGSIERLSVTRLHWNSLFREELKDLELLCRPCQTEKWEHEQRGEVEDLSDDASKQYWNIINGA